jgi:6-pyruvoyltetrahydropterin/6-carboxytetrahydropterin synthase
MTTLTRRYHFAASHRLHSESLSAAENARIFGKCNNPYGHGHDYTLEVTVAAEPDSSSGLIVPVAALDHFVNQRVVRLFAYRNLNLDVPQFGGLIPTTENLAIVIARMLEQHWSESSAISHARLQRIHIQETARNSFEFLVPQLSNSDRILNSHLESVPSHA